MIKKRITVPPDAAGSLLSDWMFENGYYIAYPCGGRGTCGKCLVEVMGKGAVPACRTLIPEGGFEIFINPDNPVKDGCRSDETCCAYALDIGTTTLEMAAVDRNGMIKKSFTCLNPQSAFGADVISRISAWSEGHGGEMRTLLLDAVKTMMAELPRSDRLFVCGNPVMSHIFCGLSPEGLGRHPFRPLIKGTLTFTGVEAGLEDIGSVTVLPAASAFVGSDAVAGAKAAGVGDTGKTVLYIDFGTNGEEILIHKNRLFCTSSSAGPAFEGAEISCGTGGVPGAVNEVYVKDGRISFGTVEGINPSGISGSGLCDLIAVLLDFGYIDRGGLMDRERFDLCKGVFLTRKDVRKFQLAQSAVRACTSILLENAGITASDVDEVILAGGLGTRIRPESALRTGILPKEFAGKIRRIGNSAIAGAAMCAPPESGRLFLSSVEKTALDCISVDPGGNSRFQTYFLENMVFPE